MAFYKYAYYYIIRPPDLVGGLRFYRDSMFYVLSSSFVSYPMRAEYVVGFG